jgi:zinc protease
MIWRFIVNKESIGQMSQRLNKLVHVCVLLLSGNLLMMGYQETTNPPPPTAPRSVKVPVPVEKTLKNGLRVIIIERTGLPLISAQMVIKSGGEIDPPSLAGLADITAALLTEGTKTRTAPQIAEEIDALGAELETDAGWDASTVSLNVMSSKFLQALEIMADVVQNPIFKQEEVDRIKKQTIDDLEVELSQPGTIARYVAALVLFGNTPYGHALTGIPQTVKRIKREDLIRAHTRYYRPDNAILLIGGNIKAEEAFKHAEDLFVKWRKPKKALPKSNNQVKKASSSNLKQRVVVIDKEDAGQSAVMLIRSGLKRTDKDFYHGIVANSVFGGGYSARLNQEIRIKRGLSYGAGSKLDVRRDVGPFVAATQTKNESGAEVASLLVSELGRLATEPIKDDELIPRKAVVTGGFSRNLEAIEDLVEQVAALALYDIPLNELNNFIGNVEKIAATDVQAFAKTRLDPKNAHIIIVGNAKLFIENLRKQFPQVEVIKESELDLEHSTLKRVKK